MKKRSKGRRAALLVGAAVLAILVAIALLYRREIRAWYVLVTRFERLPNKEQGYPEYRHRQTGIVFVRVPGATFMMGSLEEETRAQENERPQHQVTIDPFPIACRCAWRGGNGPRGGFWFIGFRPAYYPLP